MIPLPPGLKCALAALLAAFAFSSCENSKNKTGYDHVVDYTSPNTNMSKKEFPFDDDGNYREDWAAAGAGIHGVKDKPNDYTLASNTKKTKTTTTVSSTYVSPFTEEPEADIPPTPRSIYASTSSSSSPSASSSSTARKTTRTSSSSRPSSSRNTASRAKPKAKPKPKAAPKPALVKIGSGDTLYGISKRTGVSVERLKSYNGLSSNTIRDGKTLKIPPKKN